MSPKEFGRRSVADIHFRPKVDTLLPVVMGYLINWSDLDAVRTRLPLHLIGGNTAVGAEILFSLKSSNVKDMALMAAVKLVRRDDHKLIVWALEQFDQYDVHRNRFAHHLWIGATVDEIILLDPRILAQRHFNFPVFKRWVRVKRGQGGLHFGRGVYKRPVVDPVAKERADIFRKAWVYSRDDLNRISEEIVTMRDGFLSALETMMREPKSKLGREARARLSQAQSTGQILQVRGFPSIPYVQQLLPRSLRARLPRQR